jgi:hypothetical protein
MNFGLLDGQVGVRFLKFQPAFDVLPLEFFLEPYR